LLRDIDALAHGGGVGGGSAGGGGAAAAADAGVASARGAARDAAQRLLRPVEEGAAAVEAECAARGVRLAPGAGGR